MREWEKTERYQLCAEGIICVIHKDSFCSIPEYLCDWTVRGRESEYINTRMHTPRTSRSKVCFRLIQAKTSWGFWGHTCQEQRGWKHALRNLQIQKRMLWISSDHGVKISCQLYLDFWHEYFHNFLATHL